MILRPATLADADFLLDVRNDPLTRANSHVTGEIGQREHHNWLNRSLADPSRKLYVALVDGSRIGMGRLDLSPAEAVISYAVHPAYRGLGYGRRLLAALVAEADRLPVREIRGVVKGANLPSLRAFLSEGFHPLGEVTLVKAIRSCPRCGRAPCISRECAEEAAAARAWLDDQYKRAKKARP